MTPCETRFRVVRMRWQSLLREFDHDRFDISLQLEGYGIVAYGSTRILAHFQAVERLAGDWAGNASLFEHGSINR